jgi:stress-induced-phosphoprotein 1
MEREAGGAGGPAMGIGQLFADPQIISKIGGNPRTAHLLADSDFMLKLQRLRQNPASADQSLLMDQRFMSVLGLLLGADIQTGGAGSDAERRTREAQAGQDEDEEMPDHVPLPSYTKKPEPKAAAPEPEEEEDPEAKAKKEAKAQAEEEKKLGTESYKKREFDAAIEHYSKAWDLYKDVTYLTNLGAAYFEKGEYEKCIEACKLAVTEGREILADFKLIAK